LRALGKRRSLDEGTGKGYLKKSLQDDQSWNAVGKGGKSKRQKARNLKGKNEGALMEGSAKPGRFISQLERGATRGWHKPG